ncbi:hypothetical protein ALP64_204055 [Pseudomonas syringae pv. actinidiae]|nr:hypothetical protein ALP64_204055 [Pseudomonas syringae pv. actinidiae]
MQTDFGRQNVDFVLAHFAPAAHWQVGVEEHRPITHALQAADHQPLGFPQATHFAVTAFHHHAVVPVVEAFAARSLLDVGKTGRPIFENHAVLEAQQHVVIDFATHTHRVLTVHFERGVHQAVGEFTVGGEHQQPGGVDVETTDVDPAAFFGARQTIEHGRTAFRVVTGADFAIGLVVHDDATDCFSRFFALDDATIDTDGVMQIDALTEGRVLAIDLDTALGNPGLYVTA